MTIDEALREVVDCECDEPATQCGCWRDMDGE